MHIAILTDADVFLFQKTGKSGIIKQLF